jgi:hypothetical protein
MKDRCVSAQANTGYPRSLGVECRPIAVPGTVPGAALHYLDGKNGVKDFDV